MTATVVVVTVTYGERARYLRSVLDALDALDGRDAIVSIIVVDNGAGKQSKGFLAQRPDLDVVSLPGNQGSAAGFGAGIERALGVGADYIWLLDDDNRPEHGALKELLDVAATYGPLTTLQAMRPSYEPLRRLAAGSDAQEVFGYRNGFLGESVRHRLGLLHYRDPVEREHPEMPWAMYGGFLAPSEAFAIAGLPLRDYVIYADDSEYTRRVVDSGWTIRLVPSAIIDDVDDAWWAMAGERTGVTSAVTPRVRGPEETRRMYYTVRNSVHFERTRRITSRLEYAANIAAKLTLMTIVCVASSFRTRSVEPLRGLRWFLVGCWHGLRGRLGAYPPADDRGSP